MSDHKTDKPWPMLKAFVADRSAFSTIEMAVAFGIFAVGFSLLATPYLDTASKQIASARGTNFGQYDNIVTGAVSKPRSFIIRKSVLQPTRNSECIIFSDGRKYGDC